MIEFLQGISTNITWILSGVLFVYCFVRLMQQWKRTSTAKKWLTGYKNELETASDVENLELSGPWQHQWRQFCNSLVEIGADANTRTWATQDPISFFTVPGIQSGVGLNLRAISSFPATLTGLGITFTFAGLVIGVTAAGNNLESVMASEDPNLLGMIEPLLSGAGVAFVTSLVGLGLSILYSNLSNLFTKSVQGLVTEWNQELRSKWPVVNQSFVLADAQHHQAALMEELIELTDSGQTAQVKLLNEMRRSIADDLATAMIKALDQIRADRRQSDNTMVEEFSHCLSSMSEEFNASIKTMVQQFHNTVRDMAGEEIDRFAGQLKELHSEYVSANELLVATNSKMLDQVMTHSGKTLEQAKDINFNLSESTAVAAKYSKQLHKQFAETQREIQCWVLDILEDSRSVIHSDLVAAGSSLKSNAEEAGQILVAGAGKASEQLEHSGGSLTQVLQEASESFTGSLRESGKHFSDHVSVAGESVKCAGTQLSSDLAETSKIIALVHRDLQQKGVQLLQDLYEGAGYIFNDQVRQAGNELVAGSKKAVEEFAACGVTVSDELKKASEDLKNGMSNFADSARKAGQAAADEIVRGAREVSEQQQVWTVRHEKAAADLVSQIESSADNIHVTGKEVLGEWSVKVADASRALVMSANEASRVTKVIEPVLETQNEITRVLADHADALVKASAQSQKAQDQVAENLIKIVESSQQHVSFVKEISESRVEVEDQLKNLTEQFVAQHYEFSEKMAKQHEQQMGQWSKLESDLAVLTAGQRRHFNDLDTGITGAVSNVNAGLIQFGEDVRKFVMDLDMHSRDILQTLSNAIETKRILDENQAADELRALSALIKEHEKRAVVELDLKQCPAYPGTEGHA